MIASPGIPLAIAWPIRLEYYSGLAAAGAFLVLGLPIVLLGMRSLSGLGAVRKWVSIGIRLAVLLLFILILGGIRWQRTNEVLEVMVVRDISRSTGLASKYPGKTLQTSVDDYLTQAAVDPAKKVIDRMGQISFNEGAYIDVLPGTQFVLDARALRGAGQGTDAASALQLAMATFNRDAMHRMVLIWDGNATAGDLDEALNAAVAQHVPIDVMPLHYDVQNEVMVERATAPTLKRENEAFQIDVTLRSTNSVVVTGRLSVTHNGEAMDLDPYTPGIQATRVVQIKPGLNVEHIEVPPQSTGVHEFKATIDVDNVTAEMGGGIASGDTIPDNNSANIFTFVGGKGQVLYVDNAEWPNSPPAPNAGGLMLADALGREGIDLKRITIDQFPTNLVQLQGYDSIILANVPRGAGGITEEQDQMLANYVHETGGGVVMIGGPSAFGAGSWQGSKLEAELPVDMDIPAQRQIAKGALVLIMDPAEAPDGNYLGEQCALKASDALSPRDEIGMIDFDWGQGQQSGYVWNAPLGPKGDGSKILHAVKNWALGDMPSFEDSIRLALGDTTGHYGLLASDAKYKHIVLITDDDPSMPSDDLRQILIKNNISVSTITVHPHNPGHVAQGIVELAKATHGRNYGPFDGNFNVLPQIFIKEAQVIRRSLVQEDEKGLPVGVTLSSSDLIKGLTAFPSVYGMVLTQIKHNPLVEEPLVAGPNKDPLLAHWQSGLGRTAVFTSDAFNHWGANWVASDQFSKFWAQVVRGVSRGAMSTDFSVKTTQNGQTAHVDVEAVDKENGFLNFVNIGGTIVGPDGKASSVRFVQTGPGEYGVDFPTNEPGNYVCLLNYTGQNGVQGRMLSGIAVNGSAELRDLHSNDALLQQIAERTGGRVLPPFDAASADLFSRQGVLVTNSPQPIWDYLIPVLLALILIDVAARRIAWDWLATKRMLAGAANQVRQFTMTTRVPESGVTLESLKRVRDEVAESRFKQAPAAPARDTKTPVTVSAGARPDPRAKFQSDGIEGDITAVVGGARDAPVPRSARHVPDATDDSTGPANAHTSSLLEAKRRARAQIKSREDQ